MSISASNDASHFYTLTPELVSQLSDHLDVRSQDVLARTCSRGHQGVKAWRESQLRAIVAAPARPTREPLPTRMELEKHFGFAPLSSLQFKGFTQHLDSPQSPAIANKPEPRLSTILAMARRVAREDNNGRPVPTGPLGRFHDAHSELQKLMASPAFDKYARLTIDRKQINGKVTEMIGHKNADGRLQGYTVINSASLIGAQDIVDDKTLSAWRYERTATGCREGHIENGKWKGGGHSNTLWPVEPGSSHRRRVEYVGQFDNNAPHGRGTIKLMDTGATVDTEFEKGVSQTLLDALAPNGQCKLYFQDGTLAYEGMYRQGKLHGHGTQYNPDGTKEYEGGWLNGREHGYGTCYHPTGMPHLEGQWMQGDFTGGGKQYREDGTLSYVGRFHQGDADSGRCTMFWQDGKTKRYEGQTDGNYRFNGEGKSYREDGTLEYEGGFLGKYMSSSQSGRGTSYWQDGKTIAYKGQWKDNRFDGEGKQYRADGSLEYAGDFREGKWCGHGTSYWSDGKTIAFEGQWQYGDKEGDGKQYREDGTLEYEYRDGAIGEDGRIQYGIGTSYRSDGITKAYEGEWMHGEFYGQGKQYREDGTLEYEGEYVDGERTGRGTSYKPDGVTKEYEGDWLNNVFVG